MSGFLNSSKYLKIYCIPGNDTATIDTDTTEWSDSVKKTYMEVFSHGNLCQIKVLKYLKGYRKAW